MESKMDGKLTLAPCGPSLTAQTAEPHTAQCEQRQFWRSLKKVALVSEVLRMLERPWQPLTIPATHHPYPHTQSPSLYPAYPYQPDSSS